MFLRRDLSSMQRKTAKKEAWRPKCTAPRLVYDSNIYARVVYMYTYVLCTRPNNSAKNKKETTP